MLKFIVFLVSHLFNSGHLEIFLGFKIHTSCERHLNIMTEAGFWANVAISVNNQSAEFYHW